MTESEIQENIRAALNTGDTRAWRNNIAKVKLGSRWVNFGIPGNGGSDLLGLHTITITPEMVGRRVAVFLAVECKSQKGRATADQSAFIHFIRKAGGIAGVARSPEEALTLITQCHSTSQNSKKSACQAEE